MSPPSPKGRAKREQENDGREQETELWKILLLMSGLMIASSVGLVLAADNATPASATDKVIPSLSFDYDTYSFYLTTTQPYANSPVYTTPHKINLWPGVEYAATFQYGIYVGWFNYQYNTSYNEWMYNTGYISGLHRTERPAQFTWQYFNHEHDIGFVTGKVGYWTDLY